MHPVYQKIKQELKEYYSDSEATALARMLLMEKFCFSKLELFGGKDKQVFKKDLDVLDEMLSRLKIYEPIQYILGKEIFCGLEFEVNKNVLIPRPETQELVEWVISDSINKTTRILDIGTGSGCIAISLVKNLPQAKVDAWDISPGALHVAEKNAGIHEVCIEFRLIDVLKEVSVNQVYDTIVSNPPYITEQEKSDMDSNVLDWEPSGALFVPNEDPLIFYRRIAQIGKQILKKNGALYFEINRSYGKETLELLLELGYQKVQLREDCFGNQRMIKAIRP